MYFESRSQMQFTVDYTIYYLFNNLIVLSF